MSTILFHHIPSLVVKELVPHSKSSLWILTCPSLVVKELVPLCKNSLWNLPKSFEMLAKNMLSAFCQDLYGAMSLC